MGDLFGGPFFHAPVPPACRGTMGGRVMTATVISAVPPLGSWRCHPVGSMSLDSRTLGLPYESSSFAIPAVRWGGKRKAPVNFSFPLEGKCHVVAKGCTRVNILMKLTIVLLGLTSPLWRSYAGPPQDTIKLRYAVSCL